MLILLEIVVIGLFRYGLQHAGVPVSIHHPRYQSLRALLVQVRAAQGLTQTQLAQRLEVGQSYVSKIERGEAYVDVLLFADWCHACGVRPEVVWQRLDDEVAAVVTGVVP